MKQQGRMLHYVCTCNYLHLHVTAAVAQLVVAPDCGSGCRGFKSLQPPHCVLCLFASVWPANCLLPDDATGSRTGVIDEDYRRFYLSDSFLRTGRDVAVRVDRVP